MAAAGRATSWMVRQVRGTPRPHVVAGVTAALVALVLLAQASVAGAVARERAPRPEPLWKAFPFDPERSRPLPERAARPQPRVRTAQPDPGDMRGVAFVLLVVAVVGTTSLLLAGGGRALVTAGGSIRELAHRDWSRPDWARPELRTDRLAAAWASAVGGLRGVPNALELPRWGRRKRRPLVRRRVLRPGALDLGTAWAFAAAALRSVPTLLDVPRLGRPTFPARVPVVAAGRGLGAGVGDAAVRAREWIADTAERLAEWFVEVGELLADHRWRIALWFVSAGAVGVAVALLVSHSSP